MIDWSKERGVKDYCGWCNSPYISSCDGSCFKQRDENHDYIKNKKDHVKLELKVAKQRLKDLQEEKKALKNL